MDICKSTYTKPHQNIIAAHAYRGIWYEVSKCFRCLSHWDKNDNDLIIRYITGLRCINTAKHITYPAHMSLFEIIDMYISS